MGDEKKYKVNKHISAPFNASNFLKHKRNNEEKSSVFAKLSQEDS